MDGAMTDFLQFYSQPKVTTPNYLDMNNFGQQSVPSSYGVGTDFLGGAYTGQFNSATGKLGLGDRILDWFENTPVGSSIDPKTGQKQMGLVDYGLGAIGSALNAYMGFQQLGMEKKKLAFAQQSHRDNFNAQANLTNANLSDRQTTRNIDGFGENAATYMAKYGVKNV
jgi:hypothetical protein